MSVAESKGLIAELTNQGVPVTEIVVNQYVAGWDADTSDSMPTYFEHLKLGQIVRGAD